MMPKWVDEAKVDKLVGVMCNPPGEPEVKRLVIDDVRVFIFHVTHYARNNQDAMIAIRDMGPWDEVWLDHDLGSSFNENETIYPTLMMILEAAFYGSPFQLGTCYIHTDNPVGRDMLNGLSKYYEVIHVDAGPMVDHILPH